MALEPGTVLGDRFELRGVVGTGGMATVWSAWDPARKSVVALKILHPHLTSSPSERRRLAREVRATGALRHEAILACWDLHDFGDVVAISMPLHPGATLLDDVSDGGTYDAERLYELGLRVAGALSVAHERGVLHRDVTPANLLVTRGRDVVLTDFGLARLTERTATATRTLATPGYAAPEVFVGDRGDPRSDLYGLGACLFFAAVGRPPFSGAGALGQALDGRATPLAVLRPDLPADLCANVDVLLATEPSGRPSSAAAVVAALRARVVAASARSAWLEPGDRAVFVAGDVETVVSTLRNRGVAPTTVDGSVPDPDGPWPVVRGVSAADAHRLANALDAAGVACTIEAPPPPWATRAVVAAGVASTLGVSVVALVAAVVQAAIWLHVATPTRENPLPVPALALGLAAGMATAVVAFGVLIASQRPRPVRGARGGATRAERRWLPWAIGGAITVLAALAPLPLAAGPLFVNDLWFRLWTPSAGVVAFVNFLVLGSWIAGVLGVVGTVLSLGLSAVAEYRTWVRGWEPAWFVVDPDVEPFDVLLPDAVGTARERLAVARRWVTSESPRLPDTATADLFATLRELDDRVDALAVELIDVERAARAVDDPAVEAEVARIERRLERLRTLDALDDPDAAGLTARLDAYRRTLARAEALDARRAAIRASLVEVATTTQDVVLGLLDTTPTPADLLASLRRIAHDAAAAHYEVDAPESDVTGNGV